MTLLSASEWVGWYNPINILAGYFFFHTLAMNSPSEESPTAPGSRPQWRSVTNALRLLTQPPTSLSVLDRRRAHLLAWLLLVMILLTITGLILVLIVDPPGSPRRGAYVELILLLLTLFGVAYA
jgi:hypothetical protein